MIKNLMVCYFKYILCFCLINAVAFAQQPSFSRYKVDLFKGHCSAIKVKGNALAERYKTIITNTYYSRNGMYEWHAATGQNFAGHYCLAYWGCGSPCKSSAVIDLKTGMVYDGVTAAFEYRFKRNSRLLIVDPDMDKDSPYKTEYWEWREEEKKFVNVPIRKPSAPKSRG